MTQSSNCADILFSTWRLFYYYAILVYIYVYTDMGQHIDRQMGQHTTSFPNMGIYDLNTVDTVDLREGSHHSILYSIH